LTIVAYAVTLIIVRNQIGREENMKRSFFLLLILIASLAFMQCTKKSPTSIDQEDPLGTTGYAKDLVQSGNEFGLTLFKEMVAEQKDSNIVISPLSVSMALAMTYNGSAGATEEAMRSTLGYQTLTTQEINQSYRNLTELLTGLDPDVRFDLANSIWFRQGCPPEAEFTEVCGSYFDALVRELNFSLPTAADTMNDWVAQNTQRRITEIVDKPISRETVMFLIDAIYFKASWTYQFDKDRTAYAWFTLPDGSRKLCSMMEQRGFYAGLSNDDFQAVDLPYGSGRFSMTIFLPPLGVNVDSLIAKLDPVTLGWWLGSFSSDSTNVYLPKFTLPYGRKLNDALKALGMGIAFGGAADFSRMYRQGGVFIDKVKHKTYLQVDEEGTEAAAVTVVEMTRSGIDYTGFRVDRPFLFMIRENESQTILFIGKIVDPTQDE
jgi:serine protease inhibitor